MRELPTGGTSFVFLFYFILGEIFKLKFRFEDVAVTLGCCVELVLNLLLLQKKRKTNDK